jgi:predicted ATPase/DNA-binding SARP family transcriptional activator
MLHIVLFGAPQIEQNGRPVALNRSKALALLAHLALSGQPQQREGLLALLWPDFDAASARNNLRRELSLLKATLGEGAITADRAQLRWNEAAATLDVAAFRAQIAAAKRHSHLHGALCPECAASLAAAAKLYRGDLLAGFGLPDSPAFDEWLFFQREGLRQQLAGALEGLVRWYGATGAHEAAVASARRWLALDPLHEPALRALLHAYALAGQHVAALRQFEESARLLDAELGAAPEAETAELYNQIRTRTLPRQGDKETRRRGDEETVSPTLPLSSSSPASPASHSLPRRSALVGRERELDAICARLADPTCRLLTLTGTGGVGKTRLALEAAERCRERFAEGYAVVALQSVAAPGQIPASVAEALGLPVQLGNDPLGQLGAALRDRRLLLVLDNFEQLIDGATMLSALLAAAPGLSLLVTSREALNIQEEWLFPLEGLEVPAGDGDDAAAMRLFNERARQARHTFDAGAERAAVARICRLVEGLPLAIELAASWTRTLSCATIADEMERSLAFLSSSLRNIPARHRSLEAAFDQSWALLPGDQRDAFARLSVFRGGFTREAAAQVAGASLEVLSALIDKSLVGRAASGRFAMHELLRQYAGARLAADPEREREARRAHAACFIALLAERAGALSGAGQRAATEEIATEIENVRVAWRHAAAHGDAAAIGGAAHALGVYYIFRGPYGEGAAMLEAAAASLRAQADSPVAGAALAGIGVDLAWLYLRLGRLTEARSVLAESEALYEQLGLPPQPGRATDPLLVQADLAMIAGNYAEAARLGEAARGRSERHGHAANLPYAWYALAEAALAQGLYALAQQYAQNAYAAVQISQDRWYAAYLHSELGHVAVAQGAYAQARHHYMSSYEQRAEFDDPQGMAEALGHLARAALLEGDYGEAAQAYERICAMYRRTGDRGGLARALNGLGLAVCRSGDAATAREHLRQSFAIAAELRFTPLMVTVLASVAELLLLGGQPDLSVELLVLILRHPASDRETSDHAQRLLFEAEGAQAGDGFRAVLERAQTLDLDAVVARIGPALQISPRAPALLAPRR